jgi:protein-disulfide isomerase
LFLVSGSSISIPMTSLPGRLGRDLRVLVSSPAALVATILLLAGAVSSVMFFPKESVTAGAVAAATPEVTAAQQSELERFMEVAPRVPLDVPRDGAKVLIVKFNDFQCPACSHSFLSYKPILAKYEAQAPGAVKMVLKDFPLNPSCNSASSMVHPSACDAAVAVRLARQHNRGPEMEEWFYTHQPAMTPPSVREAAKTVGMVTDFESKYAATIELVKADVALGNQLGIRSTPTFFINGVKVEGEWPAQYFDQAIAYELGHPRD